MKKLILTIAFLSSIHCVAQDSVNISKYELSVFLKSYLNQTYYDSTITEQDSIIIYQRAIIKNDSLILSSCNTLAVMQDKMLNSYREAYESEQAKVIAEKKRKTLWQAIAGLMSGLFIYKTIVP